MTGEGEGLVALGRRSERWSRKSAPLGGVSCLRGKVTKSSAIPPPLARFFLHRPAVVRCAPRPLFPPRLVRSKSCAFSVSIPQFFRRSPALFSFGGRVTLLRGVKCAVPRACVTRTRQPLFVFPFTASLTPRNALIICPLWVKTLRFRLHLDRHFRTAAVAVGVRRNGRGAKLGNSC